MADFAKWIGGAIGWAVGGPIGAIIGFAFGGLVGNIASNPRIEESSRQNSYKNQYKKYRHQTSTNDFEYSLLILSAAVMKADGKNLKSELNYINQFYRDNYGEEKAKYYMAGLQRLLKTDIDLRAVCEQIRYFMEHSLRMQVIHYLFNLANSDGNIHQLEYQVIERISRYLGIHHRDFASIYAMFSTYNNRSKEQYKKSTYSGSSSRSSTRSRGSIKGDPYIILEINRTATDLEVKKAYRRLARKYHPDKVAHLGEKYAVEAREKFIIIDEAYNTIKKRRGMV